MASPSHNSTSLLVTHLMMISATVSDTDAITNTIAVVVFVRLSHQHAASLMDESPSASTAITISEHMNKHILYQLPYGNVIVAREHQVRMEQFIHKPRRYSRCYAFVITAEPAPHHIATRLMGFPAWRTDHSQTN